MRYARLGVLLLLCLLLTAPVCLAAAPSIQADQQYFDIKTGMHVLKGNVVIEHNNRVVTAGEARTNLLEVWASDNVTFRQNDILFSGDTVYVNVPDHQATIDGNVRYQDDTICIQSERVEYDWKTKEASFSGQVQIVQEGVTTTSDQFRYQVLEHRPL